MSITRKTKFGFPPQPAQGSTLTTRLVPLSQGVSTEAAWPLLPAGSAVSMSNFLPLGGRLMPRSRLSSENTIRTLDTIYGMVPRQTAVGIASSLWLSAGTIHGLASSNGSISRASFTSSFGLGITGISSTQKWQYITVYEGNLSENMVVAASGGTLQAVYTDPSTAKPIYSYLTAAPKAHCIGAFDNYILAWNIVSGSNNFPNRIQWPARGSNSNWTGEGSGFEDLLSMRGWGTAVVGTSDQRFLLFTDLEIWYGVTAAYPAQFTFYPLDQTVGCAAPNSIQDTEFGIIFFASDGQLRLLPRGGGASRVISDPVNEYLRSYTPPIGILNRTFGVYDPTLKVYYLHVDVNTGQDPQLCLVVNVETGEWGRVAYNSPRPLCGVALRGPTDSAFRGTSMFFGNSTGTYYSLNSTISQENGAAVPSVWRSPAIAADMAGNYKQMVQVDFDYRSTSTATLSMQFSQDGGNTFGNAITTISLPAAPVSGRATAQMYVGGAFPAIHLASTSTGYELHRVDVSLNMGGRR